MASMAPAAPSKWPVIDFVELIFSLYAFSTIIKSIVGGSGEFNNKQKGE